MTIGPSQLQIFASLTHSFNCNEVDVTKESDAAAAKIDVKLPELGTVSSHESQLDPSPGTSSQTVDQKLNLEKSKRGKKKASKRRRLKRPKERGKYKSKKVSSNKTDFAEIADCIFSDDEDGADYLEHNVSEIHLDDLENTAGEESTGMHTSSEVSSTVPTSSNVSIPTKDTSEKCSVFDSVSLEGDVASITSSDRVCTDQSSINVVNEPVHTSDLERILETAPSLEEYTASLHSPPLPIIEAGLIKFKSLLPTAWVCIADKHGYHLFMLSSANPKVIQREIYVSFVGLVSIAVHGEYIFNAKVVTKFHIPSLITDEECLECSVISDFCVNSVEILKVFMNYSVCAGANDESTKHLWGTMSEAYIDKNPFKEESFKETCRSLSCTILVKSIGKRTPQCGCCKKIFQSLKSKVKLASTDSPHPNVPNVLLTHEQTLEKLKFQQEKIRKRDKAIAYLRTKCKLILDSEGVDVEDNLSEDLAAILSKGNLPEAQQIFLEEQLKSSGKSNPKSHRWHPTMIRLALHIRMVSAAAYDALRDSGVIRLPCARTLFDYSHAITPQEGVSDGILNIVHDKVKKLGTSYKKFHSLICDEMYVTKNLVYRQSDGFLVGYAYLDEVDKEVQNSQNYIESEVSGKAVQSSNDLARTVLAFMVKGLASDVKFVVAAYSCKDLTADIMYARTWQVIGCLEKAGVKVLSFVCDGSATNRSFINMHTSLTQLNSGVVFDTLNFYSPESRPLFFVSDVCHLLKTIRNCFHNSGDGVKKTRHMRLNGQDITWKCIVKLFYDQRRQNFRGARKLNLQNVFPTAFSCMKVKYAAQVLSDTVALQLEETGGGNEETIKFIRSVNRFFDCLNGAHSGQAARQRKSNLAAYTDINDDRFNWLQSFVDYLYDWKKQADSLPGSLREREKATLSKQTIHGVEMTVKAFTGACRYLFSLDEPPKYIMARAFSQDPLEQHFSLQRSGKSSVNVSQFQSKQVSLAVQRELGVKKRKSNVESLNKGMEVSEEPLPKRRKTS